MTDPPAAAEPAPPERPYNPIFERLVDRPGDNRHELVGFIAYALYKRAKRHWAANLMDRRSRRPTDAELDEYVE